MSLPPKIIGKNGEESFGGSQMWLPDKMLLNSGCGIIALYVRRMPEYDA